MDVLRTYLELPSGAALRLASSPLIVAELRRRDAMSPDEYLAAYRAIGGPWHWRDRLAWFPDELARYLTSKDVRIFTLHAENALAGFFELRHGAESTVEIVYFGLDVRFIGKKLGGWLLYRACEEAFAFGASRVILNTCSLDSPHALPNYLARGFVVTRTEVYQQAID